MKITYLCTCYNEIEYLPYVVDYYLAQGIEVYIIDNYSTDGTWEWLEKRNIPRERLGETRKVESDWVIYGDTAEFIVGIEKPIDQLIRESDRAGFTSIKCRKFEFYHTGEERLKGDPRNHFFYYEENFQQSLGIVCLDKYRTQTKQVVVNGCVLSYKGTQNLEREKKELSDIRTFEPLRGHLGE